MRRHQLSTLSNSTNNAAPSLATDILRGVPEIAAFIGLNERQTYHGLQSGHIPAIKEGASWVTTKTRLQRHYNGQDALPLPEAAEEHPTSP